MIIYRIFHCLIFISTEFYIKKKGEKKIFETLISVDISFSVKIFVLLEGMFVPRWWCENEAISRPSL